jgi:hypothetical protein
MKKIIFLKLIKWIKKFINEINSEDKSVLEVEPVKIESVTILPEKKIMKLQVLRYSSQKESTLGMLFDVTNGRNFLCYTLEDEWRDIKVPGKTRIPSGTYPVTLRKEGGFHERYLKSFSDIHKGMLWVRNVPGFEYILIHIGNNHVDTAGCLLVGNGSTQNVVDGKGMITESRNAYIRIYTYILAAFERNEEVSIEYIDYDNVGK